MSMGICAFAHMSMLVGEGPLLRGGGRGERCGGGLIDDIYHTACGVVNIIYQPADLAHDQQHFFARDFDNEKK